MILAKSSALFHAKIFQTPCSNFFTHSACKTPAFSFYQVGTYAPSSYLDVLDKLQNRLIRTGSPRLSASYETLGHCENVGSLSPFL